MSNGLKAFAFISLTSVSGKNIDLEYMDKSYLLFCLRLYPRPYPPLGCSIIFIVILFIIFPALTTCLSDTFLLV